jgi:single-stranded-DNA-specific exonuclease
VTRTLPRYRWIEPVGKNGSDLSALGLIGDILATRGVQTRTEASAILSHDFGVVPDPATLPDIEAAATLIRHAIDRNHRIAVFGDYDVDGVTSTALLVQVLRDHGADVRAYLPHRERDGYGLNRGAIDQARGDGCRLLISVDCGTSDRAELEYARALGLDTVVIDHHHVPSVDIPTEAFVSPKRPDSHHPFAEYSAVGVAYQLLRFLFGEDSVHQYLPLVALGTVADVVSLTGANRAIVHHGLKLFERYASPGLMALADVADVRPDAIRSQHLGFMLGPRINAAGRIDDPWTALELLLTDSATRAEELARTLNNLNRHRQQMLDEYVSEAHIFVESAGDFANPVLVVHSPDWRIGLVGLVASRLTEFYGRPVFALEQGAPYSRGSARSIDEFDVVSALHRCADLLDRFGGHSKAAGLTIETNRIAEFTDRINSIFVEEIGPQPPLPSLTLDAELDPSLVSLELVESLQHLEPCGHGNPAPRFLMRNLPVADARRSKDQSHLLFNVAAPGSAPLRAVSFNAGDRLVELHGSPRVDLAVSLRLNTWRGRTSVTLEVVDFRSAE